MSLHYHRAIVFLNPKNECPQCTHDAVKLLRRIGIPDIRVASLESVHRELGRIPLHEISQSLYLQPGGGDDVDECFAAYFKSNRKFKSSVQEFVAKGGTYLGICLGAYAAAIDQFELVHDKNREPFFQFDEVDDDDEAMILTIDIDGKRYKAYHQGGPDLTPLLDVGGCRFGSYVGLDVPVGVIIPYWNGHGTIGLLSPHFEADDDWDDARDGRRADDCIEPAIEFLSRLAIAVQARMTK